MNRNITGMAVLLVTALWASQAGAWGSANRFGGHTEHVAGMGTEHTNAWGGSSAHAWGGEPNIPMPMAVRRRAGTVRAPTTRRLMARPPITRQGTVGIGAIARRTLSITRRSSCRRIRPVATAVPLRPGLSLVLPLVRRSLRPIRRRRPARLTTPVSRSAPQAATRWESITRRYRRDPLRRPSRAPRTTLKAIPGSRRCTGPTGSITEWCRRHSDWSPKLIVVSAIPA